MDNDEESENFYRNLKRICLDDAEFYMDMDMENLFKLNSDSIKVSDSIILVYTYMYKSTFNFNLYVGP